MNRQNCVTPVHGPNHASQTRDRDVRLRNFSIPLAFELLFNMQSLHLSNGRTLRNFSKILCRILLPAAETSLRGLKVFYDCSGGNSRPSRLSGVGGGNFLRPKRSRLSSCSQSCSCSIASEQKRSMPNV